MSPIERPETAELNRAESHRTVRKLGKALTVEQLVDAIGAIKARKAEAEAEEKRLVDMLKAHGIGEHHGTLYDANVFEQIRTNTDWHAVIDEAKVPTKIVTKHQTTQPIIVCKLTARK